MGMGRDRRTERADLRAVTCGPALLCHARDRRAASTAAVLRKAEVEAQELLAALHGMAIGASWKTPWPDAAGSWARTTPTLISASNLAAGLHALGEI